MCRLTFASSNVVEPGERETVQRDAAAYPAKPGRVRGNVKAGQNRVAIVISLGVSTPIVGPKWALAACG